MRTLKRNSDYFHYVLTIFWLIFGSILTYSYYSGNFSTNGFFLTDGLSVYFAGIITLIGTIVSLATPSYLTREEKLHNKTFNRFRFYLYYHLFLATMYFTVLVNNIGITWVAIELTTIVSALLIAFHPNRYTLEAAWKYLIICTVGIAFALLGLFILYRAASLVNPVSLTFRFSDLIFLKDKLNYDLLKLSFIFIFIGYGTKIGLAPMHTWLPDAHSQAPSPISALLSGLLLNSAMYALMRIYALSHPVLGGVSENLFIIFGLISMAVAIPFIVIQKDLKRLLAYSSIEHMGIISFALGVFNPLALLGALLHTLLHSLAKSLAFLAAGDIVLGFKTRNLLRIHGLTKSYPLFGYSFVFLILALAGLPPFGLFSSEFNIGLGASKASKIYPLTLFILFISLIFLGLIYHLGQLGWGKSKKRGSLPNIPYLYLAGIFLLLIVGVYLPAPLVKAINLAVAVVKGGLE